MKANSPARPGSGTPQAAAAYVLAYREELRARRNQFITNSSAAYGDAQETSGGCRADRD
jgi:hypothetical protein